jgi:NTE family protein
VGIPIYITATHLDTERLHVFGDDPNDRLLDALMASTALPPMHPPWMVNGERYIDGGTVTPLPLRVAVERGATEIFALHIWEEPKPMEKLPKGVVAIINRSIGTMLRLQATHDLLLTETAHKRVKIHEIRLRAAKMPELNDWSQSDRLYATGYELTRQYLNQFPVMARPIHELHPPLVRLGHVLARGWLRMISREQNRPLRPKTVGVQIENSS